MIFIPINPLCLNINILENTKLSPKSHRGLCRATGMTIKSYITIEALHDHVNQANSLKYFTF